MAIDPTPPTPAAFPHVVCWDRAARPDVFNTDALRTDPAVFLATHSSAVLLADGAASGTRVPLAEGELLDDFLCHQDSRDLHLVVGDSGTGKSHLIRWLYRQTERRGDGPHRVIRLVPRASANLVAVLREVLRGLPGAAAARLRDELSRTTQNVGPTEARRRVLFELSEVLRGGDPLPETLADLPTLLTDVAVGKWLTGREGGALARLADHFFGTRERRADADPDRLRWRPDDLNLPPNVATRTAVELRELASQLPADDHEREAAAGLLAAASNRLGGLLGLRAGDLAATLREVRAELARSGSELLLFLEDLSVLQGVDHDLMEALVVQEAGLCRLRSVVGLTNEDFSRLPDNILRGRVRRTVWCNVPVEGDETTGQVVTAAQMEAFAARYLNAVRYPLPLLRQWAATDESDTEPLPSFCQTACCPNLSDCHAAFGAVTVGGLPVGLYPLSPESLQRLYRQATRPARGERTGGLVAFNPRQMVSRVLNVLLEEGERAVPARDFPTRRLADQFDLHEAAAVDVGVAQRLRSRHPGRAERLITALELYAPAPGGPDPTLAPGVAEAFDLPRESSDPFDAWAAGRPLADDLTGRLVSLLHAELSSRLGDGVGERFTPSAIRLDPGPAAPEVLVLVRRTADAAELLRGLLDPAHRREGWGSLRERLLGLWAAEAERRLSGVADEFDRWVRSDTLSPSTTERLRGEVREEIGGQLSDAQQQRFRRLPLHFEGEPIPAGESRGLLVRRTEPAAAVLRHLWRQLHGQPTARTDAVNAQVRGWVTDLRPLLGEGADPFTLWANGGPVADLNTWRAMTHEAVGAAIDWDTEHGLAPLQGNFLKRYIHFEGQAEERRRPPGAVVLVVERSGTAGLALRTLARLRTGDQAFDPVEAEEGVITALQWVDELADEVRRQLRAFAPGRTEPAAVSFAARLLGVGVALAGVGANPSNEDLLQRVLAEWAVAEPTARCGAWRALWEAFRDHGPDVRRMLIESITLPKGGELSGNSAGLFNPAAVLDPIRQAVENPLKGGAVPPGVEAGSPLGRLSVAVRTHLQPALDGERDDCLKWANDVRAVLGGRTPAEVSAALDACLRAAHQHLRGEGAMELGQRNLSFPHVELGKTLATVERIKSLCGAELLSNLAAIDRQRMAEYHDFLRTAELVVDESAAAFATPPPGTDPDVIRREVGQALGELRSALNTLSLS